MQVRFVELYIWIIHITTTRATDEVLIESITRPQAGITDNLLFGKVPFGNIYTLYNLTVMLPAFVISVHASYTGQIFHVAYISLEAE